MIRRRTPAAASRQPDALGHIGGINERGFSSNNHASNGTQHTG
jgi:hypothetical protein